MDSRIDSSDSGSSSQLAQREQQPFFQSPSAFPTLSSQQFQHVIFQNPNKDSCLFNSFVEIDDFWVREKMLEVEDILNKRQSIGKDFKANIFELIKAVERNILTKVQIEALILKISGSSFEKIANILGLGSKIVVQRLIKRTACGKRWEPSMKGGGDKLLSDLDEELFKMNVEERAKNINCISTHVAKKLAYNLQEARLEKAREILKECKCNNLVKKLKTKEPTASYLKKAAERMGIKVMPRQELEAARRHGCDKKIINEFFDKHKDLLNRDPRLIFNMDETMVSSKRKFKILCPKGANGLTVKGQVFPHITACVTICATGDMLKPYFILANKKTLRGLEEFQGYAHFGSSESGWMNKRIFVHWAMCFLSDILYYKLKLPDHLRKQRILLILDGHKSRANFFVAKLFDLFGIDILILPGHTSHLLQPFDVSLASSLKTEYKKQIENYDKVLDKTGLLKDNGKYNMGEIRKMMITCLINALKKAGTPSVIKSGFRASGIFPLESREKP